MTITQVLLDRLTEEAKSSARLRINMDLRDTTEDGSQRVLHAMEPETIMPIHRHHASSETIVLLRGRIKWMFYDDDGNETEVVILDANGEHRMLNAERDRWHSLACLESGTVLFECQNGAYHPLEEDEIMEVKKEK